MRNTPSKRTAAEWVGITRLDVVTSALAAVVVLAPAWGALTHG